MIEDFELKSMWTEKETGLRHPKLAEFIESEVSEICFKYIEKTGSRPPEKYIKTIVFMLINAYYKGEIMRHERD